MADVILFHHAQGLTQGCLDFADELRAARHIVHAPDLYDGETFAELDDGIAHVQQLGFDTVIERGRAAVEGLPSDLVYLGFSLGVLPAQLLAQTRPGAKGALLFYSAIPVSEFGTWPEGVPLQIHIMEEDELALRDGDIDVAREIAKTVPTAELFLYPGAAHLFADKGLPGYDEAAATLAMQRVLAFLNRLG